MPMRLLPKQEVNIRQAQQKKAEIDEGLKLARRIDSLREIAAQEEASLASFRSSTLKAIQEDIKKLENERNAVKKEVDDLRKELKEGTKRLDVRENELKEHAESLKKLETTLNSRVQALKTLATKLKEQSKQSTDYYNRLLYAHKVINEIRKETEATYAEAKSFTDLSKQQYADIVRMSEAVELDLRTRDIAVASKERDLTIREERIAKTADDLRKKAILLEDREQTLERELARLKKYESNSTNTKR